MNKHILLVMKWLDNPSSVSQEELEITRDAAAAYAAAAYAAADAAAYAADAAKWVDIYFDRTGENKEDYTHTLNTLNNPIGELPNE